MHQLFKTTKSKNPNINSQKKEYAYVYTLLFVCFERNKHVDPGRRMKNLTDAGAVVSRRFGKQNYSISQFICITHSQFFYLPPF